MVGVEPTRLAAKRFECFVSAISPHGHGGDDGIRTHNLDLAKVLR